MESIDQIIRLGAADVAGCVALSDEARWNQTADDWRTMLALGEGFGFAEPGGRIIATTLALPFASGGFGWISMVLVTESHRRRGLATRLLECAMRSLERDYLVAILDATPAGREVYRTLGFEDTWGILRMQKLTAAALPAAPSIPTRPMIDADWGEVLALDRAAFKADRSALLDALRARLPAAALVAEHAGQIGGFLLGRDGRTANQLGPCVCGDEDTAIALLAAGLRSVPPPVFLDLPDAHAALGDWLRAAGFAVQRPYTRMVLKRKQPFNEVKRLFAIAGPELG